MSKISVSSPAAGTATYTISAPAGSTDRTITLPDSNGTILTTATAGVPVNGPAFSAYPNASQSLTTATWTKVQANVEEFDTNSNFDTTTYRFTPTVAGYYQVNGTANITVTNGMQVIAAVYKNGAVVKRGAQISGATYTNSTAATVSVLVYLNGSTDYVELYALFVGTSGNTSAVASETYFQAFLARSAT